MHHGERFLDLLARARIRASDPSEFLRGARAARDDALNMLWHLATYLFVSAIMTSTSVNLLRGRPALRPRSRSARSMAFHPR